MKLSCILNFIFFISNACGSNPSSARLARDDLVKCLALMRVHCMWVGVQYAHGSVPVTAGAIS